MNPWQKKPQVKAGERTLQSICSEILDREGSLTQAELLEKVKAVKADAKPASVGQCLNKWKQKRGLVRSRSKRGKPAPKRNDSTAGSPSRPLEPNVNRLVDTLRRVAALAEIVHIPEDKLPEVVRILSR